MKKTYIYNGERQTLYVGIPEIYGEFILTTSGDPTCLNELEDSNNDTCDAMIAGIRETINDPETSWERCNDKDKEYVSEWLKIWGIE